MNMVLDRIDELFDILDDNPHFDNPKGEVHDLFVTAWESIEQAKSIVSKEEHEQRRLPVPSGFKRINQREI